MEATEQDRDASRCVCAINNVLANRACRNAYNASTAPSFINSCSLRMHFFSQPQSAVSKNSLIASLSTHFCLEAYVVLRATTLLVLRFLGLLWHLLRFCLLLAFDLFAFLYFFLRRRGRGGGSTYSSSSVSLVNTSLSDINPGGFSSEVVASLSAIARCESCA